MHLLGSAEHELKTENPVFVQDDKIFRNTPLELCIMVNSGGIIYAFSGLY